MALQVLVSLSMFEMLFYGWQQLPFTCSYVPGKRPLIAVFAGYLATLWVLVPALCRIIAAMSQFTELFLFTFAVLALSGSGLAGADGTDGASLSSDTWMCPRTYQTSASRR